MTVLLVILTLLLISFIKTNYLLIKFLTNNLILKIGLMSYSLYLWHWGVLSISRWTVGVNWWTTPIQIFLIFSLSIFSYYIIEKPLRNIKLSFNKISTIGIGLISIIFQEA